MKRELAGKPRLPITPPILRRIHTRWDQSMEWDHIMLWAAMCLCFFSFLCAGEAVAPDNSDFEHLTYADIAVDNASKSTYLQVIFLDWVSKS